MENKSNRLALKDLVNIGVFALIYFVLMFVVGTPIGFMVITYLAFPFLMGLISGVVVMFFLAKVQKPWALFIFAVFPGALMTIMGHTWVVIVHSFIIALVAELVRRFIGYSSIKGSVWGHSIMSTSLVGGFWQIFLMRDAYHKLTAGMMGESYAKDMFSLPMWIIPVLYVTAIIGGLLGGLIGSKVLKKHFVKAGMV